MLERPYRDRSTDLSPWDAHLQQTVHPIREVLTELTAQQQAELLAPSMRTRDNVLRLDVLEEAWRDHRDWIPARDTDLWAEYVNRSQAAMGGYGGPPGAYPQPSYPATPQGYGAPGYGAPGYGGYVPPVPQA